MEHVPAVVADYVHQGVCGAFRISGIRVRQMFLHHHVGGTAHLALWGLGARLEVVGNGLLLLSGEGHRAEER